MAYAKGSPMAHSYSFAVVRFAPDDARGERLNVGLVVFNDESLDIRLAKRLEKIRSISAALETKTVQDVIENLGNLDEKIRDDGLVDAASRRSRLSSVGPISLSEIGTFVAESASSYEDRVASILRIMVDAEPAPARLRAKRSKLLTQVKSSFRQERVLAKPDEKLDSHRIVSSFQLDEGLVADLVLRNGAMHVIETVDASGNEDSLRKAISEIGVAALVLERARMKFGDQTHAKLVYSASPLLEKIARPSLDAAAHQGTQIINWSSADERNKFIHSLTSLATPFARNKPSVKFASRQEPLNLLGSKSRITKRKD
jgi:hypothetical protein